MSEDRTVREDVVIAAIEAATRLIEPRISNLTSSAAIVADWKLSFDAVWGKAQAALHRETMTIQVPNNQ